MLKKIPVHQLRLGMHLHKLEGAWIEHPFSPPALPAQPAPGASAAPAPDEPAAEAVAAPAEPEYPMSVELKQAAAICSRGREAVVAMFSEVRMGRAVDAEGCMPLVEEISNSVLRNPGAMVSLARLKTKDDYTYMHSVAVCALMISLGRQLGLDEAECRAAGLAGLMHDIGKALMPLEVLNKPGRLTEPEFAIMRSHPVRGHQLLLDGQGCGEPTLDVSLHHHERVDGGGYPHRLAGDDIGHFARMGAVCDVYDAITSNRPYKAGWDPAESISRMASWTGHFDKTVFSAFVRSLGIYPTGSLVRLESGRLAVVLEQNPASLVTPVVKVFFSTKSQMPIPAERLDLAQRGCTDRIVGRETRAPGRFEHLEELWVDAETLRRFRR